jgi:uridine phosphorylase
VTSAGQIADEFGTPPYFVLIEQAWRDEGTSHHYLPPAERSSLAPEARRRLRDAFHGSSVPVHTGTTWTTDAPFRETASAIECYRRQGVAAVEMEAAALYAFAEARSKPVVCFAHVTNQMAVIEGDFEKGRDNGSHDALEVIRLTARAWLAADQPQSQPPTPSSP